MYTRLENMNVPIQKLTWKIVELELIFQFYITEGSKSLGENIIAAPKMQNVFGQIQFSHNWDMNVGLFSIAPCVVITLCLVCSIFGIGS